MERKLAAILIAGAMVHGLYGQETGAPEREPWKFMVEPYLMFPNMSGTIGLGELPDVSVDADPADIFTKLNAGFMLFLEGRNERWAITSDFLFMGLEQAAPPSELINSGNVEVTQLAWELVGLRRVLPFLELGLGARVNALSADVYLLRNAIVGEAVLIADDAGNATWVDPLIVARASTTAGKWHFQFRGDVGGFGIGSDLSWQVQGQVGFRFTPTFLLTTGYRLLSMDYAQGSGADAFRYDINTFGPMVRLGFTF